MKKLLYISIFILLSIQGFSQKFTSEEQKQLDSLNAIIKNTSSHDTSLAGAFVGLSEILFVFNIDTMIPLCTNAKNIAEKALITNPSKPVALALRRALADALNNIGYIYGNQGNIPKQLDYYSKSLKIREEIGYKKGIAYSLNSIGGIYDKQGDPSITSSKEDALRAGIPRALEYYKKSLKIREETGYKKGIAISLNSIGGIYLRQKNYPKALAFLSESMKISIELGFPELTREAAQKLSGVYQAMGNYQLALENYELYITMRDSITNEETQKATAQQQAKYEYEKQKTFDDAEHEKQLAVEQEAQSKQKVITYATAGGLGLVIIFLIFVFNRLQVTKRQKVVIETQKLEVEQQKTVVEKAHLLLEEKNNEILASIRYAKRIQDALMTSQKYIERNINRLKSTYKN